MARIAAIVLAAGQGKRMKSALPKVLHRIGGRPLVWFPIDLARTLRCDPIVAVLGHGREAVEAAIRSAPGGERVVIGVQKEQRGTGDAVRAALPALRGHKGLVLVLSGDVPLLSASSVRRLMAAKRRSGAPLAFITFLPADPSGYGRVIRSDGRVVAVREHRDCSSPELEIGEVNSGIYVVESGFLRRAVRRLSAANDQGELYLTDLVAMAARRGDVATVSVPEEEAAGVNDRVDLAWMEEILQERVQMALMRSGVTIRQPGSGHVDLDAAIGQDTEIGAGARILGRTRIGRGCVVDTGAVVVDCEMADGAIVGAYSVLEGARLERGASVGPFARLRPGSVIGPGARIGNFVEVKNTTLGEGSKANHLAYLGDGDIGARVNVGAGTIFCNYDGFSKHRTVIEDDVFIGSDSQLVAPVTVGRGAYVASGSTITRDVPPDALGVARARQENKPRVAAVLRATLRARHEREKQKKERKP